MHIVVTPVLTTGIQTPEQAAVFPCLHVVLYKNKAKWKEHLVNYTFGKKEPGKGLVFESEMGEIKANMFANLDPIPTGQIELHYYRDGSNIAKKIIRDLKNSENGRPLLFVWERSISDEAVFYDALGVNPKKMMNLGADLTQLRDLGINLKAPYKEFTLEELQQ